MLRNFDDYSKEGTIRGNTVLRYIYFLQNRMYYYPTIDVSACTEVTRKIAFAIYGDDNIGVAFLKVFFTILCEAKLKDKLGYLFKDFSNSKSFLLNYFKVLYNIINFLPIDS